jgi:serine/threonine-protein kinase
LKFAHDPAGLHHEHACLSALTRPHPQLIRLYSRETPLGGPDLRFVAGRLALTLGFVPGIALERVLRRRTPSVAWSLTVARQLVAALAELHARGIVHHDVRPANVIVRSGRDGPRAVLVDLGAAEWLASPRSHAVYGARSCVPPERSSAQPQPPSVQTDIFGLGVLLQGLVAHGARTPALAALIEDATAPDPQVRRALLPSVETFGERLASVATCYAKEDQP